MGADARLDLLVAGYRVERAPVLSEDAGRRPFRRDTDVATLWAYIQEQPDSTGRTLMEIDPTRNAVVKTIAVRNGVDSVGVGDGYVWVSRP